MKTLVYIGAGYSFFFALFHCGFWKMCKWKDELKKLLPDNSAIMQTLNVHLIYYLLFAGIICIVFPAELTNTKLGNAFLLGCSGFWVLRTVNQFIFFKDKILTAISMSLFFIAGAVVYALPVFVKF